MRQTTNPNQMIVEGWDDLYSVVGVMRSFTDWPKEPSGWPVHIHMGNGYSEILSEGVLSTHLKGSTLKAFGIILDADSHTEGRYESVRKRCISHFPSLPETLLTEGVIVENSEQKRLGIWIMPDNSTAGCIEDFLKHLVPPDCKKVWEHAEEAVKTAIQLGCSISGNDLAKANLYTWLAWQGLDSQLPGLAIEKKVLQAWDDYTNGFVTWFKTLYMLK